MRLRLSLPPFVLPLLAASLAASLGAPPVVAGAQPAPRPSLVVLITVDQCRADYLTRFGPQFTGGLARLLRTGAVFTDAHHDHAITETAPGHATLLSGRFPRSTGIRSNAEGVADPSMPLLEGADGDGASPARFVGTTLADWLRGRDRATRILSVSMKDRGAILPVGRAKGDVFWYSPDGRFVTSRYYADALAPWVVAFNDRRLPQQHAGRQWTLLLGDSSYTERDSVTIEGAGRDIVFPHRLPADSAHAASRIRATPFIDDVTLAFALHGVQARGLGDDRRAEPRTDLLAISLSATDVVGHTYGPDSREAHDNILRLDRSLGAFLDSLYALRDSSRIVIALTSDHGVGTIPEVGAMAQPMPQPFPERVSVRAAEPMLAALLRRARVDSFAIALDGESVLIDRTLFRRAAIPADTVLRELADSLRAIPGVLRVDRVVALAADSAHDVIARRWMHQFPSSYRVGGAELALVVTLTPGSTWGGNVASHGSPHAYDTHVPLIVWGAGVRAGRYDGFVRTVDLAPTLAALARVTPAERLDGIMLPVAR